MHLPKTKNEESTAISSFQLKAHSLKLLCALKRGPSLKTLTTLLLL